MTKEITKAIILQEMQDKFKLRDLIPEKFRFSEEVVPVYNIEQHLEEWWVKYYSKTIPSTGPVEVVEIPANQRWELRAYDVIFMGATTCTIAGLYLQRNNASPADATIYLDLTAAQTVSYHISLETPVEMYPGDKLFINADGYTSNQTMRIYIDHKKEEIR